MDLLPVCIFGSFIPLGRLVIVFHSIGSSNFFCGGISLAGLALRLLAVAVRSGGSAFLSGHVYRALSVIRCCVSEAYRAALSEDQLMVECTALECVFCGENGNVWNVQYQKLGRRG